MCVAVPGRAVRFGHWPREADGPPSVDYNGWVYVYVAVECYRYDLLHLELYPAHTHHQQRHRASHPPLHSALQDLLCFQNITSARL
ncbi:MAG: hypothetical protein HYR94_20885 [Chloroflexi bacterium]|nr:hypothetical protein [Chloroflexota bacterium]